MAPRDLFCPLAVDAEEWMIRSWGRGREDSKRLY